MGIDFHGAQFLRYAATRQELGWVATLGRQGLQAPRLVSEFGHYCENFLMAALHATAVDSFDYSDYEGATCILDFNLPFDVARQYDSVIDCGFLEHIFNLPQALDTVQRLCRQQGQIVHVLPANNFCGHGFWQFSPELFFSLYSAANGFRETEVFLGDLHDRRSWFEVQPPRDGRRAQVISKTPLYVLCRTVKVSSATSLQVQQSDYVRAWMRKNQRDNSRGPVHVVKQALAGHRYLDRLLRSAYTQLRHFGQQIREPRSLSPRNPHLKKRAIDEVLANAKKKAAQQQAGPASPC